MSTFHFSVQAISRAKGQSAVASASYRSGEKLYSVLDNEYKSYGKRTVAPESFILAPNNAPEWVYNRERLWNEVEWIEKNKNSRLAREVRVALPIELNHAQQRKMLEEFVQENFVRLGMVADVSIHRDVEHNPHAHIMLTVRPFDENGEWVKQKSKKEYIRDEDGKVLKTRKIDLVGWDKKELLLDWRKNFAEIINEYYRKNGIKEKVSHESYEKQGLDKIPLHRLEREEYQIEKKRKLEAQKQGKEYVPSTTYAKLNYEIELANKKLEIINQKVVDLQEYKKVIEDETIRQLNNIRKSFSLSEQDWNSLKVVAKRVKGLVNFDNALDNLNRLEYLKQKLERERTLLVANGRVIESAKTVYKKNPKEVMMFGFTVNNFENEIKEKEHAYEQQIATYQKAVEFYNDMHKHSLRAYQIQKAFTQEEFKFLYPSYAEKFNEDNDELLKVQSHYVELAKNEGVIRHEIPEFDHSPHKYSSTYVEANKVLKDWEKVNESLLILERTKAKYHKEYWETYSNNWDSYKVYELSVKMASTKEQIRVKEHEKSILKERLNESMMKLYPYITKETIHSIPETIKSKILKLHIEDRNTGLLSDDLRIIQKEQMDKAKVKNNEQEFKQPFEQTQTTQRSEVNIAPDIASDFISSLVFNAKQDENRYSDLDRKRKLEKAKLKPKKSRYKDIDEREI